MEKISLAASSTLFHTTDSCGRMSRVPLIALIMCVPLCRLDWERFNYPVG